MTGTIARTGPPERTVTPAELEAERARIDLLSGGQTPPRTLHALCEQAAVLVPCGQCWAPSGTPCSRGTSGPGYHLARFARSRRRGLITEDELGRVLELAGDVFTPATIIRDGAR